MLVGPYQHAVSQPEPTGGEQVPGEGRSAIRQGGGPADIATLPGVHVNRFWVIEKPHQPG